MNDRLLSVLEDIAINLERIAEALEALAGKQDNPPPGKEDQRGAKVENNAR